MLSLSVFGPRRGILPPVFVKKTPSRVHGSGPERREPRILAFSGTVTCMCTSTGVVERYEMASS